MKKVFSLLLTLCLLALSLPLTATAETVKPETPVLEFLSGPSDGSSWRIGDSMQFRLRFNWPEQDESKGEGWNPDEIQLRVTYNGKEADHWWHGWWQEETEEGIVYYSGDCWHDINSNGAMRIEGWINWHHWYWVDENDNIDEWVMTDVVAADFQIAKGAPFGEVSIWTVNEPVEGKPLRLGFSVPRTPDWEDPTFRTDGDQFVAPYVQYKVVNKDTGKRVDIAARAAYHEASMGPWEWWDDPSQQQIYAYGASVTVTNALDAGTYEVTARVVDKRNNHDKSPEATTTFKVGNPASGVDINFDKERYELGDKAVITIDAEDARSFRIHVYAPDNKWDIDKTVKAKNGSFKYTTDVLRWQEDIRVEVYQVDGIDLEDKYAYATAQVDGFVRIAPDKKEYDVGDTAKLTLSAFEAEEFGVEVTIQRADNTVEYKWNEMVAAQDGQAVYELELEEPEQVYIRVWANSSEHWYQDARCTLEVLDEDEKPIKLKAPKGLTITAPDGKMTLNWKEVENAQSYLVFRRSGDEDYDEIASVTETSFVDKTAKAGILYSYRVAAFAVNKSGVEYMSPTSTEKSFVLLSQIKKVTLSSKASKTLVASWKKITGASAYEVYYTTSKKAPKTSTPATATTTELTLKAEGLKGGKTYYVYVRPIRTLDNGTTIYGPWSEKVTIKVSK